MSASSFKTKRWTSLIIVAVFSNSGTKDLVGFVLIKETQGWRGRHHFWKFPAGTNEGNETPRETAKRELKEETGLSLPAHTFIMIEDEKVGSNRHRVFTYLTGIYEPEITKLSDRNEGNEGEIPKFFTLSEIKTLLKENEFLPHHIKKLKSIITKLTT